MDEFLKRFKFLSRNSDLVVACGLVMVLGVMIIPIPPFFLDLFLAIMISFAMIVLLVSVYIKKPLDFSTFPSVLLVVTLFRLSLNVATTRNILLRGGGEGLGAAGEIIKAFGSYVVGGNFAVGIIIFIILIIINFIVITKGAGRVAEVAARFTLDAMPGKQMAIDADLSSGLIDEVQARERRNEVAQEADFYGAMDGASKFVRGDAIAGILITLVNIIGGIIVGMVQNNMGFTDATELFTLLTVGDGLVSQIPALIVSTSAGIIITRSTSSESLGAQIGTEFSIHHKAIYIAGTILVVFSVIPGLPQIPFWIIAAGLFFIGYKVQQKQERMAMGVGAQEEEEEKSLVPETLEDLLPIDLVELKIGYGLVSLVDAEQNGDLLERISHIRKQFATDWGVIVPFIRIKDDLELKPGGYVIRIKGIDVAEGELLPDHFLAMDPGTVIEKVSGVETVEPVFGLPAVWIGDEQKDDAGYNGYTVVDNSTIVATHLTEILRANIHEIFGRQELVHLIDKFKESYPKIVADLIPDIVPLGTALNILKNLLREGVSIRDLRTIFEAMAESGVKIKDSNKLTENVRESLYRTITQKIQSSNGDIPLFTLDRNIEEHIQKNLISTDQGEMLSLDPKISQRILASLNEKIEEATNSGEKMVVLCSPVVRQHFKRLTEKFIPNLVVISHNELGPDVNIRSLGTVRL